MGIGVLFRGSSGLGVGLATHLHLSGVILLLSTLYAFKAWKGKILPLFFYNSFLLF